MRIQRYCMVTAMNAQYRWILIPAGLFGVGTGFVLYVRERRRCAALACRMAGSKMTLTLLVLASLVVATSIVLDRFPEFTSDLLARVTDGAGSDAAGHNMKGMEKKESGVRPA